MDRRGSIGHFLQPDIKMKAAWGPDLAVCTLCTGSKCVQRGFVAEGFEQFVFSICAGMDALLSKLNSRESYH
jgi:hypothetical protein